MRAISSLIKRRPLVSFYVLTFAISWLVWSPLVIRRATSPSAVLVIMAGAFGPLLAAWLVTAIVSGREGVRAWARAIVRVRVGVLPYVFALGLPLLLAAAASALYRLLGGETPAGWALPPAYAYIPSFLMVLLVGGGQEEPGWRGFALPRLQERLSPLVASIVIGLLWALWHLPLFYVPASSQSAAQYPFGWYILNVLAVAIAFTWLYNRSKRSVFLVMLLHAGANAVGIFLPVTAARSALSQFEALIVAEWVVALVLIVVGRMWQRLGEPTTP